MITINERIKESKQKLGEKIPCSIEVLTPVHVGSGVKLAEGIDFIKTNSSVHIISQAELLKHLENDTEERDRFIKGNYKLSSLNNRILDGKRYNISIGKTSEINEFERNGNGKPYIPGSSIKGAIRTILIKKRFDELSPDEKNNLLESVTSNRKEWASEPIVKQLLGENSNYNLMRVLEVFDAEFEDLELEKILILSLTNDSGTSYGWKQLWNRQNTTNSNRASTIIAETLPINSKGYFSLSLHSFLQNDSTAANTLRFSENSLMNFNDLISTINSYSKQNLEKEKEFFSNLRSPSILESVIKEIDNVIMKIDNLSKDEFILRISWGSGWKGMTGDYLNEAWLNNFRTRYNLGKRNFPIFPKTRRIVFENNTPKYLTGWIKIKLHVTEANDIKKSHNNQKSSSNMPENLTKEKTALLQTQPPSPPPNTVKAQIIDARSKPPKIKVLEGEFINQETILPGINLEGLGLSNGSFIYVKLQIDKKKLLKAEYKAKYNT